MAKNKKAKKPAPVAKKKAKPAPAVKKAAQKAAQKSAKKKTPQAKPKAAAKTKKAAPIKKTTAMKVAPKKAGAKKTPAPQVAAKKTLVSKSSPVKMGKIDFTQFVSPLEDRLFVEVVNNAERKTAGGLYIPDSVSTSEAYLEGQVLAAGPGRRNKKGQLRPLDVRVGDQILFPQYAGTLVELEQRHFYFLSEEQILGVKK